MHKFAGVGIVDDTGHSLDLQINKWFKNGKTWFSVYVPTCEKDEFVIVRGQEQDLAKALRAMAKILEDE